jgi:small subunit ribosomal protein S17
LGESENIMEYAKRGRTFVGKVTSVKMSKTVKVEWPRRKFLYKYERYQKKKSGVMAHVPEGMDIKLGETVRISECRPISKTKNFVVVEKLENEIN